MRTRNHTIIRCDSWGTVDLTIELLHRNIEICWPMAARPHKFLDWRGQLASTSRRDPAKEAVMELQTRLNVLAAIVSFVFLTAVVLGMF